MGIHQLKKKTKQYRFCVMCDSLQLMSAVNKCRKFEHIMKHSCLYYKYFTLPTQQFKNSNFIYQNNL